MISQRMICRCFFYHVFFLVFPMIFGQEALGTAPAAKAPMMHHLHSLLVLENGDPSGADHRHWAMWKWRTMDDLPSGND
jgi:hypothetical protein